MPPPVPAPSGRIGWTLTGAGIGALLGGVLALLAAWEDLGAALAEVAAQQYLAQGLLRLALLELDEPLQLLSLAVLGGAGAGALTAVLLLAMGRGPARGWRRGLAWALRSSGLLLLAAVLLLQALRVSQVPLRADGPHVVWIVIDALRADHLGSYGYEKDTSPFMDALAADGTRFDLALSQESYTMASAASYFTSRYPPETQVLYDQPAIDTLASTFVTVAEVFKDAGYDTGAFVFNPHLFAKYRFDQGFDVYDDSHPKLGDGRITEQTPLWEGYETVRPMHEKVRLFLQDARFAGSGRPKFLYLHYRDVHGPYIPPPGYSSLFLPDSWGPELRAWAEAWIHRTVAEEGVPADPPLPAGLKAHWPWTPAGLEFVLSQYDGEIRYTDDGLADLFALLAQHGIDRDNAIVVITADHGEEFLDPHPGDTPEWNHGRTLYLEQVRVPLIVTLPGDQGRGQVVEQPVELVDVGPTLLDAAGLGARVPAAFRGRSLLPLLQGGSLPERPAFSGGNHGRGLVISNDVAFYHYERETKARRRYYGMRPPEGYPYPTGEELYAVREDPAQTRDLLREGGDARKKARVLEQLLVEWLARALDAEGGGTMELDEDEMAHLRALGYLEGDMEDEAAPASPPPPGAAAPDAGAAPATGAADVPASDAAPRCGCGLPALEEVASSGARAGTAYWICPRKGTAEACSFFAWIGEEGAPARGDG